MLTLELINNGYDVVVVDNFSNSKPIVLDRLKEITGKDIKFYELDLCDKDKLKVVFDENKIEWDMDIVLVEGPFDHIVVPNSIPLLGKVLKTDFKLYQEIFTKANANIIVWLDGDAVEDVKKYTNF